MTDLVEEMRNAAEFGGYEHDCPDWQGLLLAGAARIDKLQAVADRAVEVMGTVHNGYREEIDFMGLWESLVAADLMPPDEGPDRQDRSSSGEHGPAGATGDTADPAGPTSKRLVHAHPVHPDDRTPCCGLRLAELPGPGALTTTDPPNVTCKGEPAGPTTAEVPADLAALHDAALPHDAPGAWIRSAIEARAAQVEGGEAAP